MIAVYKDPEAKSMFKVTLNTSSKKKNSSK